ncbi:hypothetical protein [Ralstonia solanacearum]|uniref:hypothetical protein n=1 Tax=Ralstonia solanacearum TaxID=305 RepID=UPI000B140276|nr:hypothetical protein [Ralstonia solanacearum]
MTTTNKTGNSIRNRAVILNSPIPTGHSGRNLTSTECRALRALGWSVSERYFVVQVNGNSAFGIVYYPASDYKETGVCNNAGIYVETK